MLYAWARYLRADGFSQLPAFVAVVLLILSKKFKQARLVKVTRALALSEPVELFRIDAKAEGDVVRLGGWDTSKTTNTKDAPWFRCNLDRSNAPWVYRRGEPFRTIASLELLAVLVAIMVLVPRGGEQRRALVVIRGTTDNRGNKFVVTKLLTSKWPGLAILAEIAEQLEMRDMLLDLDWVPRLQNPEADAITNDAVGGFSPEHEIEVDIQKLDFVMLHELLEQGEVFFSNEFKSMSEAPELTDLERYGDKGKRIKLKQRDPW